ncbi:MAG: VOC family protein [Blastocatellia bacterium]
MSLAMRGLYPLIQVFDMPVALAFYRDLLGFEIVSASGPDDNSDWVWLRLNDADLMLNTMYESDSRPAAPEAARTQAHGDTAFYFGCPDVDAAYEYLLACGVTLAKPVITGYGMKQLYVKDPDGYNLCFQWNAAQPDAA